MSRKRSDPANVLADPADVLAQRTRELREKKGLSQEELAAKADLDRADLSRIETAKALNVGTKKLKRLATALGVGISDLLAGA
jgi:transcriptional regulator with XRE-family HTH domain